ncbi:hypothetical protein [Bacillus pakistanensis]|nr:hypothetical protein [Bacillus pakistanensis]
MIFLIAGVLGFIVGETSTEYMISGVIIFGGLLLFILTVYHYRKRKSKNNGDGAGWGDCAYSIPDCDCISAKGKKGMDCDSLDCDCTPDCSP